MKLVLIFFPIKEFMVQVSKESIMAPSAKSTISTITGNFQKNLKDVVSQFFRG